MELQSLNIFNLTENFSSAHKQDTLSPRRFSTPQLPAMLDPADLFDERHSFQSQKQLNPLTFGSHDGQLEDCAESEKDFTAPVELAVDNIFEHTFGDDVMRQAESARVPSVTVDLTLP